MSWMPVNARQILTLLETLIYGWIFERNPNKISINRQRYNDEYLLGEWTELINLIQIFFYWYWNKIINFVYFSRRKNMGRLVYYIKINIILSILFSNLLLNIYLL